MKRFFALLLTIALVFTLAACATEPEGSKKERKRSTEVDAVVFSIYINYNPEVQSSTLSAETIRDIITSTNSINQYASVVLAKHQLESITIPSAEELKEKTYVTSTENSDVIQIGVALEDQQLAMYIADAMTEVIPKVICETIEGTSTRIVDSAHIGTITVE